MSDITTSSSGTPVSEEVAEAQKKLEQAQSGSRLSLLKVYLSLSGPGWMQSALTLGGGSLAASLYLGIIGGTGFLWLQPVAVIMGIIMLSAVFYVVLSTGENPFHLLRRHLGPVVAWSWLVGAGIACLVWAFPQFSLAAAVVQENLLPGVFGSSGIIGPDISSWLIGGMMALLAAGLVWAYDAGIRTARFFDYFLKALIALMFLSFFGVLFRVSLEGDGISWTAVISGLLPDFRMLLRPASAFEPFIQAVDAGFREFWIRRIVTEQRDLIISTAAVVVGVNSTVLLAYSMIKKGWNRQFRGLAIFDLSTGFFLPFVMITGCMVIVSASLFHAEPVDGLLDDRIGVSPGLQERFEWIKRERVVYELNLMNIPVTEESVREGMDQLKEADLRMAAMLVHRDAFDLSRTLQPLTGDFFSHILFGLGVLGLAISTVIIQMVTWGFVTCEMLGVPKTGWPYRLGALPPAAGMLAPFIWTGQAQFWLVVPTSLFVAILLPIAYLSFVFLMNKRAVLGRDMPGGWHRLAWNLLMAMAALFAVTGSIWSMWSRIGGWSVAVVIGFFALVLLVNARYRPR